MTAPLSTYQWKRRPSSLMTKGGPGRWDQHSCYAPAPIRNIDGSLYRDAEGYFWVYYSGSMTPSVITDWDTGGVFKTKDFIRAEKISDYDPVLMRGPEWYDRGDQSPNSAVFDGTTFHVFSGSNSEIDLAGTDNNSIGYASGPGPDQLTKAPEPIILPVPGGDLYHPSVLVDDDGTWKMGVYERNPQGEYRFSRFDAPAPDGPWARIGTGFAWDPGVNVLASDFFKRNGEYTIIWPGATMMEYATSLNGDTGWTPQGNLVGAAGVLDQWDSAAAYNGKLIEWDGKIGLIYNASAYADGIGIVWADATPPPPETFDDGTTGQLEGPINAHTYTVVDRSTPLQEGRTVSRIGFYSTTPGNYEIKIVRRDTPGNYTVIVSVPLSHDGTGDRLADIGPFTVPAGEYFVGVFSSGNSLMMIDGHPRAFVAANPTGTVTMTEQNAGQGQFVIPVRVAFN